MCVIFLEMAMSDLFDKEWKEMIHAFLKLTPEQRSAEAEQRLDETLERMSKVYNILPGEAYEKLIKNRDRILGSIRGKDGHAQAVRDHWRGTDDIARHSQDDY